MTAVAPTPANAAQTSFLDPTVLARIGNLELLARDGRRRVHQRPASLAAPRRVDGLRRASRVHAGRRHPSHRLAAVRAERPALHQGVRSGHEHELHRRARHVAVDAVRRQPEDGACRSSTYAMLSRGVPRVLLELAARPRGHGDDRPRHRGLRAAVGQASATACCTRSTASSGRAATRR